jgi:hypothetical protein
MVLENGDVSTVMINQVLGYSSPEAGKYYVPCGLLCNFKRRNAKCAKLAKKFGHDVPKCRGQFFYVRAKKGR